MLATLLERICGEKLNPTRKKLDGENFPDKSIQNVKFTWQGQTVCRFPNGSLFLSRNKSSFENFFRTLFSLAQAQFFCCFVARRSRHRLYSFLSRLSSKLISFCRKCARKIYHLFSKKKSYKISLSASATLLLYWGEVPSPQTPLQKPPVSFSPHRSLILRNGICHMKSIFCCT